MKYNYSKFHFCHAIDSCSIENILASRKLLSKAKEHGCNFAITDRIYKECLHSNENCILNLLLGENPLLKKIDITTDDIEAFDNHLDSLGINHRSLHSGEFSLLALSYKIDKLGFFSDDEPAYNLAKKIFDISKVCSTDHFCGYLFYNDFIFDWEIDQIFNEFINRQRDRIHKRCLKVIDEIRSYRTTQH